MGDVNNAVGYLGRLETLLEFLTSSHLPQTIGKGQLPVRLVTVAFSSKGLKRVVPGFLCCGLIDCQINCSDANVEAFS